MGVTVAEGTEEVGVLDLLPVLLGVAANESDSDPSSFVGSSGGHVVRSWEPETEASNKGNAVEPGSGFYLEHPNASLCLLVYYDFIHNKILD